MNSLFKHSLSSTQILSIDEVYNGSSIPTPLEYTKEDFIKIIPEFKHIFTENDNNKYNIMFDIYSEIGRSIFSDKLYGKQAIMCLSLWIAHNLTVSLGRTKNINNETTLNTEFSSTTVSNDKGSKSRINHLASFKEKYSLTIYGQMLYPIMQQVGSWSIRGVY